MKRFFTRWFARSRKRSPAERILSNLLGWGGCLLLALAITLDRDSYAQEKSSQEVLSAGTHSQEVLLLQGNRIVRGKVSVVGETFHIEQSAGKLVVSRENVLFHGPDLRSAYVFLQDSLTSDSSAEDHIGLARWCLSYQLLSEARMELQAALKADPRREDVRRNLAKLDTVIAQPNPSASTSKTPGKRTPAEMLARQAGMMGEAAESLAGLDRETGQQFTRKIQPILMHSCAAAACHGPASDNPFKLSLIHFDDRRMRSTTEKNLLALMPYIDREHPQSGQLWKLLKNNHGATGRTIFPGTRGQEQLQSFQQWLLDMSESDGEIAEVATPNFPVSTVQRASHNEPQRNPRPYRKGDSTTRNTLSREVIPPPDPFAKVSPGQGSAKIASHTKIKIAPRQSTVAHAEHTLKEPVLPVEPPAMLPEEDLSAATAPISSEEPSENQSPAVDPFDPEEFNRKHRVKRKLPDLFE